MTINQSGQIERAKDGDRAALAALIAECRPIALKMANGVLRDPDDAQDVCQNAMIELTYRLPELRDPAALLSFLRQVVLHQCFDYRKRRASRRESNPSCVQMDEATEEKDIEGRLAIWESIGKLPESEREPLILDLVEGYRHCEIARKLGVAIPTVRSRLQSAKRRLRPELRSHQSDPRMNLEPIVQQLVDRAFPGAIVESVETDPEMWLPYSHRLKFEVKGEEHVVVVRKDVDANLAKLLPALEEARIPCPRLLEGPTTVTGDSWSLWQEPNGANLTLWTMDGTYHRFRTATDLALNILDRLQAFTDGARGLGVKEMTLRDRFQQLVDYQGAWREHAIFSDSLARFGELIEDAERPLVYTNYLHYFPNWLRIKDGEIGEVVYPFGTLGDPLLGLAMVWIYDCYPFVHTGFVEQYLVRHNVPRRDFAIRLAVQTLFIISLETLVTPNEDGKAYQNALFGLLDRAWRWIDG